jgi:hypothetical protein
LGTWLLSILAGHSRYAHVTGLRGDGVSREILGIKKIVSEDALRRALARMSAEQSQAWLQPHLLDSVGEALKTPWILDIDTTIKPLYGKREGAEVGYNPHKPGRPSHALHTYWAGNLRLVLDVVVAPGNKSSSADTRPGLGAVLDRLQPEVFCWLSSLRKRAVWQARLQPPLLRHSPAQSSTVPSPWRRDI